MRYLLKGGRVVDPSRSLDRSCDLLVENGIIAAVEDSLPVEGAIEIDLAGKTVVPGFVDMHVHLREPGFVSKETIASGVAAAVAGGITSLACMPNTEPAIDSDTVVEQIRQKALDADLARVYPVGALTRGLAGKEAADFDSLYDAGVRVFSDDGGSVENSGLFLNIMRELSRYAEVTVIAHCEDGSLASGGVMHEGVVSKKLGLPGIPSIAETAVVARDILLAREAGVRLHLAHLSTAGSLELLDWARSKGLPVTAEVTPHHLLLTESAVADHGSLAKVNPPLRTEEDRLALCQALRTGLIDIVATDHAPHHADEKKQDITRAPFGITGLETALPLMLTELVGNGLISLSDLVMAFAFRPARLLGLPAGTLQQGAPADLVVLDPGVSGIIEPRRFYSLARHSPFSGRPVSIVPVMTMVGGLIKMDQGVVSRGQQA